MIRDDLADALRDALLALGVEPLPEVINLEQPGRREHGDWSSNVALASAKKAGRALEVMSKSAKRWEAELISREWRRH